MTDTKETTSHALDKVPPISPAIATATLPIDIKDPNGCIDPSTTSPEIQEHGTNDTATKQRSRFRLTMIIAALFLCLFLAALDATIVATAVPTITADLHSPAGYAWIGGAYLIANAAGAPIWGSFSDIFGRKPITLAAVLLFIGSSIMCALATNMKMLIIGRAIQGIAGGGLILMVNVVISDLFSMRQRSLFLGLCEGIWALAGAVGPILGGVLTSLASWRWCWWINLPFCGIAFVLILVFLDVHNPRTPIVAGLQAIDWPGSLSILAFTLLLLLGLDFGGDTFPWSSPKVICLIIFGVLSLGLFVYSERKLAKYPLIPLALFKEKSNLASLGVCFFHGMAFIAGEYYMPLYFQSVHAASPLRSGILLVPLIVMTAAFGIATGVFIHQTGKYRVLIWVGTSLLTLGEGLFISLSATTSTATTIGFLVVTGSGAGLLFEPPLISLQAFVPQKDMATATSTFSFIRCIALSISVILGGVVFQNSMDSQSGTLRDAGLSETLLEQLSGKNAAANVQVASTLTNPTQKRAVEDAFASSMKNMWIMYCAFAALSMLSGVFVKSKKLSREHTETVTGVKEREKLLPQNQVQQVELRDRPRNEAAQ